MFMEKYFVNDDRDLLKIPPFRDAHIHFTVDGRPASAEQLLKIKDDCMNHGVFALTDMGHRSGIGMKARSVLHGHMEVRSAVYAIYKKKSHGVFLGIGVTNNQEIKDAIRTIADAGVDFIKVIASGIVCPKGGGLSTTVGFNHEELKIIAAEAKERNLKFVCHANADSFIRNAIEAGTSSIEHGFYISNETLHMMKEAGVSWTPTVTPLQRIKEHLESPERRYVEDITEQHLASINYAASIGVKLNVGTDCGSRGVYHGESFIEELQWFHKAGLSLKHILSAACMHDEEIEKGSYLLVKKDFVIKKRIEEIYFLGERTDS
jgi:imidazolonepropionase-like amidohydrolase